MSESEALSKVLESLTDKPHDISNALFSATRYILMLPNILFVMFALYLKDTQDILQGINKLDYLVKLSISQIPKSKNSNRKETAISDNFIQSLDSQDSNNFYLTSINTGL